MDRNVDMKQFADIKVLIPAITGALDKKQGFMLNMVGPIYIGGKVEGETKTHGRAKSRDAQIAAQTRYLSTEALFEDDISMNDFIEKARIFYFRAVATRHDFDMGKICDVLGLKSARVHQIAKLAGVKVGSGG